MNLGCLNANNKTTKCQDNHRPSRASTRRTLCRWLAAYAVGRLGGLDRPGQTEKPGRHADFLNLALNQNLRAHGAFLTFGARLLSAVLGSLRKNINHVSSWVALSKVGRENERSQ